MVELRENEGKTLLALKDAGGRLAVKDVVKASCLAHAAVMRAALMLESKNLVRILEKKSAKVSLNEEGKTYAEKGLPERTLINELIETGGEVNIKTLRITYDLKGENLDIPLGWLIRKKWGKIEKKHLKTIWKQTEPPPEGADEKLLSLLNKRGTVVVEDLDEDLQDAVSVLKRRKIVDVRAETLRELELTEDGWKRVKKGVKIVKEVSQLTPELIATGKWREVKLLKYDIKAPVARVWPGKKHPYLRFLDELKEKLVALGFKEMLGPNVELSFFNCDGLYMPQDHPAREIHDMYFIKEPKYGNLDPYKRLLENVKKTHENGWKTGSKGWGYSFSVLEAARLMLCSQTTASSARMLISDELEIPGKYFAIARCYRPDVVDRIHLTEFNQVEGIVLGESLTLLDLLGILEKFAMDIAGADYIKFKPGYFPFTEPSVELHAYKKGYGWIEAGGSGIFRPEVTLPLGVEVPVLAWGLGVDRLFMMKAEIDDIRYLFTRDLDWLRWKEMM